MVQEYTIDPCSGKGIDILKGQKLTIIDIEGQQVADFFAETKEDPKEFLSTSVTIDCNESLKLKIGDFIYTNLYNPMFRLISDDVGEHDLLHPCCRKETYDFFYNNGDGHPNCFDNINMNLRDKRSVISPVNFFMYTKINTDGTLFIEAPLSKPGDKVILIAEMDACLSIAACSVSEGLCNGGKCSSIKVIIED